MPLPADSSLIDAVRALADGPLTELASDIDRRGIYPESILQRLGEMGALRTHMARRDQPGDYGIIGTSPALLQALGELERVSEASATVLLLGESGTGKELFARAVHLSSQRRDQLFIKVNCAAIPDTLFESELFGCMRNPISFEIAIST